METNIFKLRQDQTVFISSQGLQYLLNNYDPKQPHKNILWASDYTIQLPIKLSKTGIASEKPVTLIEQFERVVRQHPQYPALSKKVNQKWITMNYREYFEQCVNFGKSLIDLDLHYNAINIIGCNAKQWNISFFGSLFAQCLPVGIYATNSVITCHYIATHSQCKLVVAQNWELAKKYTALLEKGDLKYIVIYNQNEIIQNNYDGRVVLWNDFVSRGKTVDRQQLLNRMKSVKPGHCCTLVYTSGTTGMPKGVMLSHDNYTWINKTFALRKPKRDPSTPWRLVSYLPLSHVAGQFFDVTGAMIESAHVFIAQKDAIQKTLIDTLLQVRPTFFFGVPRIWYKIQERIKSNLEKSGLISSNLYKWAQSIGCQGTLIQANGKQASSQFNQAKKLVYDEIKKSIGLDKSQYFMTGSAPFETEARRFFLSFNFLIGNSYGMTQLTGPISSVQVNYFKNQQKYFQQAGTALQGTQIKIQSKDLKQSQGGSNNNQGQICCRGRTCFMGYYKNPEETKTTIDEEGFVHSGDIGILDNHGVLFITGRIKELIITSGAQNIPPILIQNEIKNSNKHISNVMLVGDNRKFLTALVTLKTQSNGTLQDLSYYQTLGSTSKTLKQATSDQIIFKAIKQSIDFANQKAISRAQKVQNFAILAQDFSLQNNLLTPSLKLRRKQVSKRYEEIIQRFYSDLKI